MTKKTFFASDFHLGTDALTTSLEREKKIVRWLDSIKDEAEAVYLLGDIFDYWFEYGRVIPKGYSRFCGKLTELRSMDIPIYFFTGNHDMWMFDYFEEEYGIPVFHKPQIISINEKQFFLGHGDGLGPGDRTYKMIKKIFSNPLCQWLFARIHPNLGMFIMQQCSKKSRDAMLFSADFSEPEKEWLVQFAESELKKVNIDYFVFGHRHLPIDYRLSNGQSRYINIGDWLSHFSYAVFDGKEIEIKFFEAPEKKLNDTSNTSSITTH